MAQERLKGRRDAPGKFDYHLGICIPTRGLWPIQFAQALQDMIQALNKYKLPEARSLRIQTFTAQSSLLPQNRHTVIAQALQQGVSHMLLLDDDMVFPPKVVHGLMMSEVPFIGANYPTRSEPPTPTAVGTDGKKRWTRQEDSGLEEVHGIGLGCCLIESWVFKELKPPFFNIEWNDELKVYKGEDIYFCEKVRTELGIPLFIDHDLSKQIRHVGEMLWRFDLTPQYFENSGTQNETSEVKVGGLRRT